MTKIKDIPIFERPIERLVKNGAETLSNEELISILLHTGYKDKSAKDLALVLLNKINDITALKDISLPELLKIKGIGTLKATTILAALELSKRVNTNSNKLIKIKTSDDIYNYFKSELENKKQEYFYCIYLDVKKRIIESKLLFIGTLNFSLVNPREVFKRAYLNEATSIICIHNHPSGDPEPSKNDIDLTNHLIEIGKLHNIHIDDHIIIGSSTYFSFFENNLI